MGRRLVGFALAASLVAAASIRAQVGIDRSTRLADETALASRFAPIVRLVAQPEPCGPGEPYDPIDVDALFDNQTVAMRGPWGMDLVKIAPAAGDLTSARYGYVLDFPGNALHPGCGYEQWARRITAGRSPTVYAHVATDPKHPGKLSLQYWLYYAFNDWNNTHEGDWEMIQLDFDAATPRDALATFPFRVGYSQHEGAEEAEWGDPKMKIVDDTHVVVHPAAGSHANFYGEALYLGTSGSEGVGCDDTRGPTRELRPVVVTLSSDRAVARAAYPWIEFAGQWGEVRQLFFNGPTGPNLKEQWVAPITWHSTWRQRAIAVPAAGLIGTRATSFFCDAVESGSNSLRRTMDDPLPMILGLGFVAAILALIMARTTWRPTNPLRLARRRAGGQVLAASSRMYRAHWPLFLGIGLMTLPISIAVTLIEWLVAGPRSAAGHASGEQAGVVIAVAVAIAWAIGLVVFSLVVGATARAMLAIDADRPITPIGAYRDALRSLRPLTVAQLGTGATIALISSSLILLPVALWLLLRWALIVPALEIERLGAGDAIRRSARLARHGKLKIALLALAAVLLASVALPFFTALVILLTNVSLSAMNVLAGIAFAAMMPFVGIVATYLYFDARVHEETTDHTAPDALPAEIQLA
jgi:hypothetical protein